MKPLVYERIVPAALAANRERGGRKAIERDIELTRRRIAAAGGRVPDGLAARLDGLRVCLRLLDGLESIRNNLAVTAKDRALTQADVDAHAASYVFGERSARRRTNDPVEAEALELARRLVRKKGNP
jgi:hypothetical protein